jgi:Bacterial regulatory helix-turn-helix protein, lysR family
VPAKTLDLNLLPIAFALYDELSVSRAARLLGMSQPAVSMALRRMRESFDDPQPRGREAHPKGPAARPQGRALQVRRSVGHVLWTPAFQN